MPIASLVKRQFGGTMTNPPNRPLAMTRRSWLQAVYAKIGCVTEHFVDIARWRSSTNVSQKLSAIIWPKASVAAATVGVLIGGGAWILLQSDSLSPHAPRLPTEQEWEATQAAVAFEGELSPALAAANHSVPSEVR